MALQFLGWQNSLGDKSCHSQGRLGKAACVYSLAHRNRIDACDLRLQCPSWTQEIASDFLDKTRKAMVHCDLRVRWKVAGDFAISSSHVRAQNPLFLRNFWRLAPSTRKSLAIAIVRFWCTKVYSLHVSCLAASCSSWMGRAWHIGPGGGRLAKSIPASSGFSRVKHAG